MYEELAKRLCNLAGLISKKQKLPPGADTVNCSLDALKQIKELAEEAADAIEELSKYANTIMRLKSEGWYLQQTKHHDGYEAISTMPLPELPKEEA